MGSQDAGVPAHGEKAWLQKKLLNSVVSISNSSYQPQNSYHPVPHIAQARRMNQ